MLLKDKTFNGVALLTLALCIGANTAIFSVINAVLLRPLPYPEPDRLVQIYNSYPGAGIEKASNAAPDYFDRKQETDLFEELAMYQGGSQTVGIEGSPEFVPSMAVTPSFFRLLQIPPVRGRIFTEEEGERGNHRVVILAEGLWQQMLGGSADAIGQDVRLSGNPYTVVGIMPDGLWDPDVRMWVPLTFTDQQRSNEARHSNSWEMLGRLRPEVSLEQVRQRLDAINKRFEALYPPNILEMITSSGFNTRAVWLRDEVVGDVRDTLWILQGAVFFVLLIGCANVANLLLVRSNVRLKELSVRAALGAGRWRLGRLLLTESGLLGLCGGILGFGVGVGGVRFLRYLGADRLPRAEEIGIDITVLAFALGIAVVTGLLFGTIPVFHVLRSNLAGVFQQTGRSGMTSRTALVTRAALVVGQVALAFILLVGSGLLIESFLRANRVNPGFNPDNVLTAHLSLPGSRYGEDADVRGFVQRLMEGVRSLPGVRQVSLNDALPFTGRGSNSVVLLEGRTLPPGEMPPVPTWTSVNAEYFQAMGIPLITGRTIADTDTDDSQPVVVIDRFLADRYFRDTGAIGQGIRPMGPGGVPGDTLYTIVGVVGSIQNYDLTDADPRGVIYFSYLQRLQRNFALVIKQERPGERLVVPVRAEILRLDPEMPLYDVEMMADRVEESLLQLRAMLWLSSIFAGLALLLAAVGIYGVLAYAVSQRTPELGTRMALGADASRVLRLVATQGMKLAVVGLAVGAVGAVYLTRFIASVLYDVAPTDTTVFLSVAGVLALAALFASLIPAFRATRIHPATALRHE